MSYPLERLEEKTERETIKAAARKKCQAIFSNLETFLTVSEQLFNRVHGRVDLDEYRCHLVRSELLAARPVHQTILVLYPPSTGKIKIAPGGSDWHPRGVKP